MSSDSLFPFLAASNSLSSLSTIAAMATPLPGPGTNINIPTTTSAPILPSLQRAITDGQTNGISNMNMSTKEEKQELTPSSLTSSFPSTSIPADLLHDPTGAKIPSFVSGPSMVQRMQTLPRTSGSGSGPTSPGSTIDWRANVSIEERLLTRTKLQESYSRHCPSYESLLQLVCAIDEELIFAAMPGRIEYLKAGIDWDGRVQLKLKQLSNNPSSSSSSSLLNNETNSSVEKKKKRDRMDTSSELNSDSTSILTSTPASASASASTSSDSIKRQKK